MSTYDMPPRVSRLPGENKKIISDEKIIAANSRLLEDMARKLKEQSQASITSKIKNGSENDLELIAEESDVRPEEIIARSDLAIEKFEDDLSLIERTGPDNVDRRGLINRTLKEVVANLEYFEETQQRLRLSHETFLRNTNKLRAFRDYLTGL